MRVFVAGASGAVGRPLVAKLVAAGHEVTAMTRSAAKRDALAALGATPVECDVYDAAALAAALTAARPEVVVNQLTDLPQVLDPRGLAEAYRRNDRVRTEGAANLLAAARAAGARRYVGQSIAIWYAPEGPAACDEDARLWLDAPAPLGGSVRAIAETERLALTAPGIEAVMLRYGSFYGPGTWYAREGDIGRMVRARRYPRIGAGAGVTSFLAIDDAASAAVAALTGGAPGAYNVCDDEPAEQRAWLPAFAAALGAKPPFRVPLWLARLVAGDAVAVWAARERGAANARFKTAFGWSPATPSWREGFQAL